MNGNQNETRLEDGLRSVVQGQTERKGFWEIFYKILRIGLIPAVGFYFTLMFNNRQNERNNEIQQQNIKIAQIQTLEKFMPYLIADDEKGRSIALLSISTLVNDEFAIRIGELVGGSGSVFARAKIADSASTEKIREYAKQSVGESLNMSINDTLETREGWMFVGTPHGAFRVTEYGAIQFPPDGDFSITKMDEKNNVIRFGTDTPSTVPNLGDITTYLIEGDNVIFVTDIDDIKTYPVGADTVTVTIVPESEITSVFSLK